MTVVNVGIVRMLVDEPRMEVDMRVRFPRQLARTMRMLVMRVMQVSVLMRHRLVLVDVLVMLHEMQIEP